MHTLAKFEIRATFFLIGERAAANPDVVEAIHDQGHRIGNHTYTHASLPRLTASEMHAEIERTDRVLRPFLSSVKLFRFPFGDLNGAALQAVADAGYRPVGWNVDPRDWDVMYQPNGWVRRGLRQIRRQTSAVIVAHDGQPTTAEFLETFILQILALGEVQFQAPSSL